MSHALEKQALLYLQKSLSAGLHGSKLYARDKISACQINQSTVFQSFPLTLPKDKSLNQTKLKAFADDKINVTENMKFVLERVKRIVVTSIFSFSHNVFKAFFLCRVVKS